MKKIQMDLSKNSIKNFAILSSFLAISAVFLCFWEPLTIRPLFFSDKDSSDHTTYIQKDELEVALEKASMANKTVIITIINKAYVEPNDVVEYPSMLDLFLEGFWVGEETRQLVDHLLVVSMDETAHERCRFRRLNCYRLAAEGDGGDRFAGEKVYMSEEFIEMMWRRTHFLQDVLRRGYSFVFTDSDVLWLRNPFRRLMMMKNEAIDLQISTDTYNGSRSYDKKFINTGFYFIRSNNKTVSLFQKWYEARKNSSGMKEQDVLVKLIRHDHVLAELQINTRFLKTQYFSGFCKDSGDVRSVMTVHANCCRSIKAKVADLKAILRDWKRFQDHEKIVINGDHSNSRRNGTSKFRWSKHVFCRNSWHQD